ncbi:MAG: BPSL0067 family protein [Syntrophobacterales bacterium]|nr:BPSL0067 family protein [Syntrophobacterales bacterium]
MAGPYVYPNPTSQIGKPHVADIAGNYLGECVSLVKRYIPELKNRSTSTWTKGPNVIETLKNGGTIMEGTAIATFVNGRFVSGHGHAAFFVGSFDDPNPEQGTPGIRIIIVEQFKNSVRIIERKLFNRGKNADGSYVNPSNNGEAFSVIL